MKRKIFFALAAVLMLGFVACNKDDDKKDNGNNGNASLVGTWKISAVTSNGQDMSAMLPDDLQITMNANGSGAINMYGTDYAFTWTATATTLKVDNGDQVTNCTIVSLTANECILTSDNMIFPGMQEPLPYTVTITLTRIGGGGDNNNYSTLIVGTWQTTQTIVNGHDVTAEVGNVELTFTADGRGLLNDHGETENNGFSWSISGNTITIDPDRDPPATFTILNLDGNTCTFTGTRMPGSDEDFDEIRITMTKVNN
ncbi:MAG: lipocalin family protein [bacterium]